MINFTIPLPKEFYSVQSRQKEFYFDLRTTYYTIGKTDYPINLLKYKNITYWSASTLKESILVTLFTDKEIINSFK